jgi:hypothetical protein
VITPNKPHRVPPPDFKASRGRKVVSDPPWWETTGGGWLLLALFVVGLVLFLVSNT